MKTKIEPGDIEKLKAIGYKVDYHDIGNARTWWSTEARCSLDNFETENDAWGACKIHSQTTEGMKATMADKVKIIGRVLLRPGTDLDPIWDAWKDDSDYDLDAQGPSPEAAVDALFWKMNTK